MADRKLALVLLVLQLVLVIIYALLVDYKPDTSGHGNDHLSASYVYFQDIHIMIFVGFGYLMTFLRRYGFSSLGFNMMLAAIAIEWSIIAQRFLMRDEIGFEKLNLKMHDIIEGDIAAAAILISFGAVLGRLDPFQLIMMTLCEVVFFALNFWIGVKKLGALDAGGSIFIHTFGAYFGLAVSAMNYNRSHTEHSKNGSVYHSDLFAFIGTVFLWVAWPSFNAALVPDADGQFRAIVNTYLSLIACTVVSFAMSSLVTHNQKFDAVHIQNATLAGGVAVGACANFNIQPFGAMILGSVAAVISVLGYEFITPKLGAKARVLDTCGVHNLHGMPGVLSAIASIISIAIASRASYGDAAFYSTFSTYEEDTLQSMALHQLAALGITLLIAIGGGALTGLAIRWKACNATTRATAFEDGVWWSLPDDVADDDIYDVQAAEKGEAMTPLNKN